jgi:hypothetical protein
LSIHYGDSAEPWLRWYYHNYYDDNHYFNYDDNESNNIRDLVLATLQRWNIVSVVLDTDEGKEEASQMSWPWSQQKSSQKGKDQTDNSTTTVATQQQQHQPPLQLAFQGWPFHPLYSLRRAVGRLESCVLGLLPDSLENRGTTKDVSKLLLSSLPIDDDSSYSIKMNKVNEIRCSTPPTTSDVPILEYIHEEEIFGHIFSFGSYKRIGKLQQVCQIWKSIIDRRSNIIWKDAYMSRFGPAMVMHTPPGLRSSSYSYISSALSTSWKDLFYQKHIAEKSIRHRRHAKTGFKFRICPHVGCLFVIKSERQQHQHLCKHRREQEKSNHKTKRLGKKSNNQNCQNKKGTIASDTKQPKRAQTPSHLDRKRQHRFLTIEKVPPISNDAKNDTIIIIPATKKVKMRNQL